MSSDLADGVALLLAILVDVASGRRARGADLRAVGIHLALALLEASQYGWKGRRERVSSYLELREVGEINWCCSWSCGGGEDGKREGSEKSELHIEYC